MVMVMVDDSALVRSLLSTSLSLVGSALLTLSSAPFACNSILYAVCACTGCMYVGAGRSATVRAVASRRLAAPRGPLHVHGAARANQLRAKPSRKQNHLLLYNCKRAEPSAPQADAEPSR